jgi:DNA polymerase alpha subunit B
VLSLGEGEERRKCICINPGRMAKGGGGSFDELNYQGSPYKDECFNYRH